MIPLGAAGRESSHLSRGGDGLGFVCFCEDGCTASVIKCTIGVGIHVFYCNASDAPPLAPGA